MPPSTQQPVQKGATPGVGREKGQAHNLTAEEEEAFEKVVTRKTLVYSILVLSLFDSGASHCHISSNFTALHAIPLTCMDNHWEISIEKGVFTVIT